MVRMFAREPATTEQLIELLHAAHQHNLFDADALAMLEGVLQVDDMQVRDIMIPRSQVVSLERDTSPDVQPASLPAPRHRYQPRTPGVRYRPWV